MMRLLSWAWWAQQAASVPAVAGVIAVSVALAIAGLLGAAVWLRSEGASAERARCTAEWATAKVAADKEMAARVRESEERSARYRGALLEELENARIRAEELELALLKQPKSICYPKDIARRLNQ